MALAARPRDAIDVMCVLPRVVPRGIALYRFEVFAEN
jgi:hypothetical protein